MTTVEIEDAGMESDHGIQEADVASEQEEEIEQEEEDEEAEVDPGH